MKKLAFVFFVLHSVVSAQIFMMGVAPLKPGNYWKYIDVGGYPSGELTACYYVTDSTMNLVGHKFNVVESFDSPNYIRYPSYKALTTDSTYIRYAPFISDSIYTYYKANCKLGDSWVQPVNEFATYTFTVIDTFHVVAWGKSYFSKLIRITDFNVTFVNQVWTDHIGLLEEQGEGEYHMVLRGCVIDGVIYGDTTTITGINEEIDLLEEFSLQQNYPNPFNPTTSIQYAISSRQFVTLKVYDLLGKEVTTLVNEEKSAGNYEVEFYAGASRRLALTSGVYYYQLSAGDYVETKKMILMK